MITSLPNFNKQQLREEIRSCLKAMPPALKARLSGEVCMNIRGLSEYKSSTSVLLYSSLRDEADLALLLSDIDNGKRFYFPKVVGENLTIHPYTSPADLQKGAYGIMEPITSPVSSLSAIPLVLVPGLGFDVAMNRLGKGKGYYDRLLAQMPHCLKVGVCFNEQLAESIPCQPFDVKMDVVITPTRVMRAVR